MTNTMILGVIFSLYFMITGFGMLLNRNFYQAAVEDIFNKPAFNFLTSLFTLVLGILLVTFHNVWVFGWPVVITVICWIIFIKGILRVIFPNLFNRWSKLIGNNFYYYISCSIVLLIGIYLAIEVMRH